MRGVILFGLLFGSWPAFAALTRDALNQQYRGLKGFTAEAVQSKSSPYLIKPLQSAVTIAYQNEILSWRVAGQEPFEVRFSGQKAPEFVGGEAMTASMPVAARAKLLATLQAVRDLILMDPRMDEDFQLVVEGQKLRITPRPDKVQVFFQEISLVFSQDLQLRSMLFKAQDDVTELTFSQLKWMK